MRSTTHSKTLALFLPSLAGGGAERAATTLAASLHERGWAVDMVLARAVGPLIDRLPDGVRVVDLHARRAVAAAPALVRYLQSERPATLMCSIVNANVVGVAAAQIARPSPRTVIVEHTTISRLADHSGRLRHRFVPPAARWAHPRADAVVAVSHGVADDVARATRVRRSDITVIPNPVLTDELFSSARAPLRHPWFGSGEPPVVLGVGSLTGPKDFPNLVSAFARVRRSRPARLMILGEGHERPRLQRLVSRLGMNGDVLLPGFVRNPYPYMANAALLAVSSRCEGLPTVLIESLALGTPTVSTDCRSGPREILDGGRYGRLVTPGDTAALAAALGETLDGDGPAERPDSLTSYSPAAVADRYEALLSRNGVVA